ncbi:histidine phosphatase superfamily [Russula brevipes]|nr:histidine phosphatase superfamily [Russula brevipes]
MASEQDSSSFLAWHRKSLRVTATVPDPNFPDESVVGFPGPTPTGDEALAIETAPAIPAIDNESPIVRPDTSDHKGKMSDMVRSWGNLSPMFSLPPGTFGLPDASPIVPEGCSINAILTPLGRQQLYELGVNTRIRLQFAAGFFGVQEYSTSYHQLIEIESPGFNSTLAPYYQCPNANNAIGGFGAVQAGKWASTLQPFISGVNLTATDIVGMQQTCAYESVALGFSRFCDLFTEYEWESFEYLSDLGFWYSTGNGPGNSAVAVQGIGYVSEVISRLTQTRITKFDTSVNATIVSSDIKFPLKQPIFVDASHDTVITAVAVVLNLTSLASSGPLPTDHIQKNRQWIISHIAPFATNLVAQLLTCPASGTPSSAALTHIRWILNDAVVPLTGVKGCKANKDGLCDLPTYINGTQERIAEVDYQFDCFGNYSIPIPDTIVDGRPPPS